MYTGPSRGGSGRRYPYDGNYGRQYEKSYYDNRDNGRNQYYERRSQFPFLTFRIFGLVLICLSILILILDLTRIGLLVPLGGYNIGLLVQKYYGGSFIASFVTILITGALATAISPYKRIEKVGSLKTGFLVMAILNCVLFIPGAMGFDIWVIAVTNAALALINDPNVDLFNTGVKELDAWFGLGVTMVALNCMAFIVCIAGAIVCCLQYNGPYPEDMKTPNDPYWRDPRYHERYDYDNYGNSMPRRGESMYRPPPPSYHTYPQRY